MSILDVCKNVSNISMTDLINTAKGLEHELDQSRLAYDPKLINKGVDMVRALVFKGQISVYDIYQDGLNMFDETDFIKSNLIDRIQTEINQDGEPEPYTVNDLDFLYNHDDESVLWINGYDRLELVSCDDLSGELDDIIDYIKEHNLEK